MCMSSNQTSKVGIDFHAETAEDSRSYPICEVNLCKLPIKLPVLYVSLKPKCMISCTILRLILEYLYRITRNKLKDILQMVATLNIVLYISLVFTML